MTEQILPYLLAINLATLAVSIMDKGFAVYAKPRVPEKLLLGMSFFGGAIGALLAQFLTGHKRLKVNFRASLMLIAFLQASAVAAIWSETVRTEFREVYESAFSGRSQEEPRRIMTVSRDREMPRRFGPGS